MKLTPGKLSGLKRVSNDRSLVGQAAERGGRGLRENFALLHALRSQGRQ